MGKSFLGILNAVIAASVVHSSTAFLSATSPAGPLKLRTIQTEPEGEPIADIIFIHGFADRADNHDPLFAAWTNAGFRVIAFDLPSHGETRGDGNDIDKFSFSDLGNLVVQVERQTRSQRPLFLAAWSVGGLVAVHMLETHQAFSRPVNGVVLITPAVAVHKAPWTFGDFGRVTVETLTHNSAPPHKGPIKPTSPFLLPMFSVNLLSESLFPKAAPYPHDMPTLVFVAGDDEDRYVESHAVRTWAEKNAWLAVTCPGARHEMDNELPYYGSEEVIHASTTFLAQVLSKKLNQKSLIQNLKICHGEEGVSQ